MNMVVIGQIFWTFLEGAAMGIFATSSKKPSIRKINETDLKSIGVQLHQIPTEEAPKFDYRSHSFDEALKHLVRDILAARGAGGIASAGVKAAYNTIVHHKIEKRDLTQAAALGSVGRQQFN